VRFAGHQLRDLGEHALGDAIEAGLEIVRLLVFVDVERIAVRHAERAHAGSARRCIRLDADVRRRHRLGVRAQRELAKRALRLCFDLAPDVAHIACTVRYARGACIASTGQRARASSSRSSPKSPKSTPTRWRSPPATTTPRTRRSWGTV